MGGIVRAVPWCGQGRQCTVRLLVEMQGCGRGVITSNPPMDNDLEAFFLPPSLASSFLMLSNPPPPPLALLALALNLPPRRRMRLHAAAEEEVVEGC